jgi:hypothetical protein
MKRGPLFLIVASLLAAAPVPVSAWGPHSEITRAAIDALPEGDRLEARLGAAELERYAWLPDFHQTALPEYTPSDFLVFPGFPQEVSHLTPDVQKTYRPYFRRCVQALRMESRTNADRWVGALIHFVEDSGSPPHAFPTGGPLHARMEGWVDGAQVTIAGYRPRRLARNAESGGPALEKAMERRIAEARKIGELVRPLCEKGDRAAAEPHILKAANWSAEATADLLHTLLSVTREKDEPGTGRLEILTQANGNPTRPQVSMRMRLLGTGWETFSDPLSEQTGDYYRGRLWLRNLPPAEYEIEVSRPGLEPKRAKVTVRAGGTERLNLNWVTFPVN